MLVKFKIIEINKDFIELKRFLSFKAPPAPRFTVTKILVIVFCQCTRKLIVWGAVGAF